MSLTVVHSTFVIERSFSAAPERVFAAFSNPVQKRRWYTGGRSMEIQEFEMDFRPGGRDRALYRFTAESPFPGTPMLYETVYQDIVPDRRIVLAYSMTLGDRRISASLATFEMAPSDGGTDLVFTEQGAFFEGSDGPQMREDGWRKLLERLAAELAG
jgi:uncharacterized protein YndB with AHSA1/START domain